MNLGIILGIGESLNQMDKFGQKDRFINNYLRKYAKHFDKIYLFSYENETCSLPKNITIISKKSSLHRYLYALLIAIINRKQINDCDILRGFGLTSAVPALLTQKPFIFNLPYDYNKFLKIEKKYYFIPLFYILEKIAFLRANIILVATKHKFKTLKEKKFIYLPNGVDLRTYFKKDNTSKGIVFVGRLERQKNLFFLIDAVSKLPKHLRSVTFIGTGSLETDLRNHATKKNVTLTIIHPVENTKLPILLRKYAIFALPSMAEGSPKVLLEAMAIGLVPVVTNFSTAKEIIKDNMSGFITNYDVNAYSRRMEILIKNPNLCKKMSQFAVESIASKFNLEKLILKEINILKTQMATS